MRRLLGCVVVLALLCTAVLGFAVFRWQQFLQPFPAAAAPERQVEVTVAPGTSAQAILERLEAEGVLADATLARLMLVYGLDDPPLQAGDYRFELPATPEAVLDKLIEGDVVLETVTVIEGLTLEETAEHLASEGFGTEEEFLRHMRSPALVVDLDPEAETLEGYLFPDTYSFPRGAEEAEIVEAMVTNFRRQAAELLAGRDARRVVVLASIVEKEATLDEERPLIAGVYAHRLRRGIALYADPTIIYGKKLAGTWNGNLTREDLRTESPWNTYLVAGLPPGPICSPGRASLEAAANPADVPYLYFVSRNDGSHVFAETLREHNRNVEQWQRRYWRERP